MPNAARTSQRTWYLGDPGLHRDVSLSKKPQERHTLEGTEYSVRGYVGDGKRGARGSSRIYIASSFPSSPRLVYS